MNRIALTAVFAALCQPALSAPWQSDVIGMMAPVYLAYQSDPRGGQIIVDCNYYVDEFGIWVRADLLWDPTADYAPVVEPIFTIDGVAFSALEFQFQDYSGLESIVAYSAGQPEQFDALFEAITEAKQTISVSYFDKALSFSAEGVGDAVAEVQAGCAQEEL